jgi:hypothetical protein
MSRPAREPLDVNGEPMRWRKRFGGWADVFGTGATRVCIAAGRLTPLR